MLTWLAKNFEKSRAKLQARLEDSLQTNMSTSPLSDPENWRQRGNELLTRGDFADAEACYRKGILEDARDSICYSNLGFVLVEQCRWEEAARMLGHAIALNPADADAHFLLGNIARDRRDWNRAARCYQTALSINPDFALCRSELSLVFVQSGQLHDARKVLDEGPGVDSATPQYHFFKACLHLSSGEFDAAIESFETAKRMLPHHPDILWGLGWAQLKRNDALSALKTAFQILELQPNNARAYDLKAIAYQLTGQHDLAINSFRKAIGVNPEYLSAHQNLLSALGYFASTSPLDYLEEAQQFAEKLRARAQPYASWPCNEVANSSRPLRVGFVSGDLRHHSVSMFLDNVLPFLNPQDITCIAYSNALIEDAFSEHLKPMFSEWTQITFMADDELAKKIHDDHIDVLVDLSGHTAQNRISVFAWRPAPVQVSWLGYWASTGLAEVDYILVDRVSVREEEAQFYTEKLWYLPDTRLCFSQPATSNPMVSGVAPSLRLGYVTFGSFQSISKITSAALEVWSQLLKKLPSSRLRLQSMPLSFHDCTSHMRERLHAAGIDLNRVDLVGAMSRDAYLNAYADVDLVLDTFPFPGGATTAEALWMGVPTVTLAGNSLLARQGESMLRCVGLADWVATDEQHYIHLVLEKVGNPLALSALRASLREIALASPLFDGATFAKNLTYALQRMTEPTVSE